MRLRSSSTPVTGSLIPSFSNTAGTEIDDTIKQLSSSSRGGLHKRSSTPFSCSSSSPHSPSECNQEPSKGFGRAFSDGDLKGLAYTSCDIEEFRYLNAQKKSSLLHNRTMLKTEPSFSIFISEEDDGDLPQRVETLTRTVPIGDCIEAGDFSFGSETKNMALIEEEGEDDEDGLNNGICDLKIGEEIERPVSPPMYLATGLGIDVSGFDYDREVIDFILPNFDNSADAEEYYQRMIDEYPHHPLFLRNYAQLLQAKGDLYGAEDYYHRATMADPGDGEILMQYAKLIWELHHDQSKASIYFERAVQAAPQNSNVLAAHASFLWEVENDEEDDTAQQEHIQIKKEDRNMLQPVSPSPDTAEGLWIDVANSKAADGNSSGSLEEYLGRMVEENPCNALFLRNYAQLLSQKGDLQGAQEYYSRAILVDPADGEVMSQYARLVWELHHDHDKALSFFERAVEATPGDSHVLAAYANFLWEAEDEEAEDEDHFQQVPQRRQGAMTTTNA